MCTVAVINAVIWACYAVLKKDIPLFMTNSLAFCFMSLNLTFYMWACNIVPTSSIQLLINFFQIAFPEEEAKDQMVPTDDEAAIERRLDENTTDDEVYRTKAESTMKFTRKDGNPATERITEETRLTINTAASTVLSGAGKSFVGNYYTGAAFG